MHIFPRRLTRAARVFAVIASSAAVLSPQAARAQDVSTATVASRAEVRIGGSRAWPDLIAPGGGEQWRCVRDNCDGFYINNFAMRLSGAGGKEKRAADLIAIRDLLKNKSVFYETDLIHSSDAFDSDAIQAFADAKFRWVGSTINYGNSAARTEIITDSGHLPLYFMFGPWHGGGDIAKPENAKLRSSILAQAGGSVDGPVTMWSKNAGSMKTMVYSTIRWCHANHKKFLYLLAPNESGKNFLRESQHLVRDMEDNGVSPDIWAVSFYGPQSFRDLLETLPEKQADGQPAPTFMGTAYWLIQHLRDPKHWARLDALPQTQSVGVATATYRLHNDSGWLDLCPVIRARIDDAAQNCDLRVLLDGRDVTAEIVADNGLAFVGPRRLTPGAEHLLQVQVTKRVPEARADFSTVILTLMPHPTETSMVAQRIVLRFDTSTKPDRAVIAAR